MVTSRPVPQQTAQMVSPFAGQKRAPFRFSQTGQATTAPKKSRHYDTPAARKEKTSSQAPPPRRAVRLFRQAYACPGLFLFLARELPSKRNRALGHPRYSPAEEFAFCQFR